ncbi:MAG: hypothetical protein HRU70_05495 [Phycisphaeraceae bacterium]|nr:MAG: hypothetical protein HRU70_05495 [Phycisphaeraceae bacterium]
MGGVADAPITVERNVLSARIVADTFLHPITIGEALKGAVIARTGSIPSLTVGFEPRIPNSRMEDLGFMGSVQRPDWFPLTCQHNTLFTEPQSVISAAVRIGELRVSNTVTTDKLFPPRIETPEIGLLRVGVNEQDQVIAGVQELVLWSGITRPPPSEPGPDPAHDSAYTKVIDGLIGTTRCGRVVITNDCPDIPTAIYLRDVDRFEFMGSLSLPVYLPKLSATETLRIHCQLDEDPNQGDDTRCGRVIIRDPDGLQGQIVINHANVPGCRDNNRPLWTGRVEIGGVTLAPDSSQPDQAPFYERPSHELGGGAVGVVPFSLYPTDHEEGQSPYILPQGRVNFGGICTPDGLRLRFYGPVYDNPLSPWKPVRVRYVGPTSEIPVSSMVVIVAGANGSDGQFSREIAIYGKLNTPLPPGTYRIYRKPNELLCDLGDGSGVDAALFPESGVNGDFISFVVLEDCDKDCLADSPGSPCDRWGGCPADFNEDGFLDFFDVQSFVDCYEGTGCPPDTSADFNDDLFVDFFDFESFSEAFDLGC